MSDVARILGQIEDGDSQGADTLLPLVYDELRRLVAKKTASEDLKQIPTAPLRRGTLIVLPTIDVSVCKFRGGVVSGNKPYL